MRSVVKLLKRIAIRRKRRTGEKLRKNANRRKRPGEKLRKNADRRKRPGERRQKRKSNG